MVPGIPPLGIVDAGILFSGTAFKIGIETQNKALYARSEGNPLPSRRYERIPIFTFALESNPDRTEPRMYSNFLLFKPNFQIIPFYKKSNRFNFNVNS
ncbi:hypothetical protein, partial [Leptospira borgpetersenii]